MNNLYAIWATVSGGVTGSRAAWLKANGSIQTFESRTEAEKRAHELRVMMAANHNASFTYTVEAYD